MPAQVPASTPAADAPRTSPKTETKSADVVVLGPPTADGAGVHVLRAREERLEAGELRPLVSGRPIVGEVVSLKPREDNPRICDVASSYTPPTPARKGPGQIASPAYRQGWDEIFGKAPAEGNGPAN